MTESKPETLILGNPCNNHAYENHDYYQASHRAESENHAYDSYFRKSM
jgi:hypothetical protein